MPSSKRLLLDAIDDYANVLLDWSNACVDGDVSTARLAEQSTQQTMWERTCSLLAMTINARVQKLRKAQGGEGHTVPAPSITLRTKSGISLTADDILDVAEYLFDLVGQHISRNS